MIDIVFLGNGGMMPTAQRWLSSTLLRVDRQLILLDCGEGVQVPWRTTGWGFRRLSLICLSHCHADHLAGLPGVLHALALAGREEPVTIIGPKGTRDVVAGIKELAPVMPFAVVVADLADGQSWQSRDLAIDVRSGDHRVPVLVYRFTVPRRSQFLVDTARARNVPQEYWSRLADGVDVDGWRADEFSGPPRRGLSIGFATDTRPTEAARQLVEQVDLLIAEGTYGDDADQENAVLHKHMTFREAATLARDAGVARLILTHFSPKLVDPERWLGTAQAIFPAVELAETAHRISLNFSDD